MSELQKRDDTGRPIVLSIVLMIALMTVLGTSCTGQVNISRDKEASYQRGITYGLEFINCEYIKYQHYSIFKLRRVLSELKETLPQDDHPVEFFEGYKKVFGYCVPEIFVEHK